MQRNWLQVAGIVLLLLLGVCAPILYSGYSELRQAQIAGSPLEVAEHYKAAARRIPWRADLYELAGHAYYHAKDYPLADEMYQIAEDRNALSPEGWVAWGDVNYLHGDPVRAAEIWESAFGRGDISTSLYSRLAKINQEREDYSLAAQFLQKYVSVHSDDASARYRLGLLLTLSDPQAAITELIAASQLDPQFDPAARTLRTALNLALLTESRSDGFVITGRGLGLVEEWELARAAFQSAVDADGENAEAWAWLGEADQQTGGDGGEELDRALQLNPNSSTVRGLRGLYFQRVSNHRQALIEFQTAASLEPENPARFVTLGDAFANVGDLIRALEAFQYATTLAPEDPAYWHALAKFCGQNGVNIADVGIPAAQRALVIDTNDPASEDLLGWLWLINGSHPDAERHLLRALELDPQYAAAHLHLGMLYLQTGDRDRALNHLSAARDLGDADASVLLEQYFP
ncbi:MAG TPA: tetratricopeptide repeat protein [Anaerolineales bacterium]|nr:tetratricopeptide repeat protein [Anaerolineales bacterium]